MVTKKKKKKEYSMHNTLSNFTQTRKIQLLII